MLTSSVFTAKKGLPRLSLLFLLTATSLAIVAAPPDDDSPPSLTDPLHFDQVCGRQIGEYEVQSGLLRRVDNTEAGSLVSVKRADGAVLAIVERGGKSGLLQMAGNGEFALLPDKPDDFDEFDTPPMPALARRNAERPFANVLASNSPNDGEHKVIEVLAGFSRSAADHVGDAQAYALAQVESVNLALHNSRVSGVSLELAGIQIIDQDYPITTETLAVVDQLFPSGKFLGADLTAAFFVGNSDDVAPSLAYSPGRLSVQSVTSSIALRHSLGHNAGGGHCNDSGSGYNFGYDNGRTRDIMCGNASAYYSSPDAHDRYDLPMGNAQSADMARVWRENADRLSSYAKSGSTQHGDASTQKAN
jgi:hypothetical protein